MIVDKVAKELYDVYCVESENYLKDNIDFKDAEELVSYAMSELKKILPADKRKFFYNLENYMNHRENIYGRETYMYAFKQGAAFVLELLKISK